MPVDRHARFHLQHRPVQAAVAAAAVVEAAALEAAAEGVVVARAVAALHGLALLWEQQVQPVQLVQLLELLKRPVPRPTYISATFEDGIQLHSIQVTSIATL